MRLTRLTTEYIAAEDRLRLAGEVAPGQAVVLWLTRRLVDRMLPHLFDWLVKHDGAAEQGQDGYGELRQGMAQESARASLPAQPPVDATSASCTWLVASVDVTVEPRRLRLGFAAPEGGEPVLLDLEARPLRQWLNIVHDRYRQADWPMGVWPAWMTEAARPVEPARVLLH